MRSFFAFLLSLLLLSSAAAVRAQPIPEEAKAVRMTVTGRGDVLLGEQRHRIAASAQFRDTHNRIVQPASLRGVYAARVILDRNGDLWRAWLVRPVRERARQIQP